jgi:ATP-binding cassette subfamily C exporter for protease/lipase
MKTSLFSACLRQVRLQAFTVFMFSAGANLLMLVSSIYMMQVFDRILSSGSHDTLLWLTFAALLGMAAFGILEHARRRITAGTGSWLEAELSTPVIARSIDARLAGSPAEASLADIADLKAFLSGEAILAFFDAPWMPLFIGIIWLMHPVLGALALSGAILLFGFALLNDLVTRARTARAAGETRALNSEAEKIVEQAEVVRSLGMTGPVLARWSERQRRVHAVTLATSNVTEVISNTTRAVRMALQILILGLGAFLVLAGDLTSGGMIAASIILGRALSPVERALGAWRSWVSARKALSRLTALFDAIPAGTEKMKLPAPRGRISLTQVHYTPPASREPILQRLEFAVEPGTTCGVLGPSGSGKTTLCRIIIGAWKPSYGHVRLDGADLSCWEPDELGRYIGYLPQDVQLFPGTVAENIARMGPINAEAVARAAMLADVHEMILRMPAGYETDVGSYGSKLSGGQRQRIGLARALYGDPVLVVLDEPNSNLDSAGEEALFRTLRELKKNQKTVLIVAHQPSALRTADTLIVMRDGTIETNGTRDEVLKQLSVHQQHTSPMRLVLAPGQVARAKNAVAVGRSAGE